MSDEQIKKPDSTRSFIRSVAAMSAALLASLPLIRMHRQKAVLKEAKNNVVRSTNHLGSRVT